MSKLITIIVIILSLILHASILRIFPFSELNLVLIICLLLYEKFDVFNSLLIGISLLIFALIDPTKTLGFVFLEFSLSLIISETLFRLILKRSLKLINFSDLLLTTSIYYIFEVVNLFLNNNFNVDNLVKLLISFILNTIISMIVLNLVNGRRKNRLEMPRFK